MSAPERSRESAGQTAHEEPFDIARALLDLSLGSRATDQTQTSSHLAEPAHNAPATPPSRTLQSLDNSKHLQIGRDKSQSSATRESCLVVLQEACKHHKFSRSIRQRDLDAIVERPERTRAAILGILNTKAHLVAEGLPNMDLLQSSRIGNLGDKEVEDVHGSVYPQDLLRIARKANEYLTQGEIEIPIDLPYGDLYLGPRSLEALHGCIGALYDGMDALLSAPPSEEDPSITKLYGYQSVHVCVRPPGHHAAEASPCGFCWINNIHIAIAYARRKYSIKRAVILDFDLHHGDGSQSIAWTLNEAIPNSIGYYSLHDIYSYPCESGNVDKIREASVSISAHGHNIHNVTLAPYKDLAEFDELYNSRYSKIFDAAEKYLSEGHAKGERTIVCISAGYDASEYESAAMQRHAVSVPTSFYERFTRDATRLAKKHSGGKLFSVMEGGYGNRAITSAASAHILGLVRQSETERSMSHLYDLELLKVLERHFPAKQKSGRKTLKPDASTDSWLPILEKLYAEYIILPEARPIEEQSAAADMQKMTLRERKGKATPLATPGASKITPRSTPVRPRKSQEKYPKQVPDVPPVPDALLPVVAQTNQSVVMKHEQSEIARMDSSEISPREKSLAIGSEERTGEEQSPSGSDHKLKALSIYDFPES